MACSCQTKKDADTPLDHVIDEPCLFCAEKHFSEALCLSRECGYNGENRHFIIGALVLAQWHLFKEHGELAEQIRNLRHYIQNRRENEIEGLWREISLSIDRLVSQKIKIDEFGFSEEERGIMSGTELSDIISSDFSENIFFEKRIFIFSNVTYPKENALQLESGDIATFLNRSRSIKYYRDHKNKVVVHRSPERSYGDPVPEARNLYVFGGKIKLKTNVFPERITKNISSEYNYNYSVPEGKVKCPTTGFYAALFFEKIFPNGKIFLVNFGNDVKNSSYRYPGHNWEWENKELSRFEHIYTE